MTPANLHEPPRLATWLLRLFSSFIEAPLVGDLVESFRQGRSSVWYWRQVLWAILIALPQLLRKKWGCLAYALICSGFISVLWMSMFPRGVHSGIPPLFALFAKGFRMQWPWSLLHHLAFQVAFQAVIVAFELSIYLTFSGTLIAQNLLRPLLGVFIVLAVGNLAVMFLGVSLMKIAGWALVLMPTTVATLFAILVTNQATIHTHSPR